MRRKRLQSNRSEEIQPRVRLELCGERPLHKHACRDNSAGASRGGVQGPADHEPM